MTENPGTAGTLSSSPQEATAGAEGAKALREQLTAALAGTAPMDLGSAVILDRSAANGAVEIIEVTETGEALLAASGRIIAAGAATVQAW